MRSQTRLRRIGPLTIKDYTRSTCQTRPDLQLILVAVSAVVRILPIIFVPIPRKDFLEPAHPMLAPFNQRPWHYSNRLIIVYRDKHAAHKQPVQQRVWPAPQPKHSLQPVPGDLALLSTTYLTYARLDAQPSIDLARWTAFNKSRTVGRTITELLTSISKKILGSEHLTVPFPPSVHQVDC